jgi:hypothetical protein
MLIFLPRHATAAGVLVGSVFIFRDPGVLGVRKKVFHTIDERWGVWEAFDRVLLCWDGFDNKFIHHHLHTSTTLLGLEVSLDIVVQCLG